MHTPIFLRWIQSHIAPHIDGHNPLSCMMCQYQQLAATYWGEANANARIDESDENVSEINIRAITQAPLRFGLRGKAGGFYEWVTRQMRYPEPPKATGSVAHANWKLANWREDQWNEEHRAMFQLDFDEVETCQTCGTAVNTTGSADTMNVVFDPATMHTLDQILTQNFFAVAHQTTCATCMGVTNHDMQRSITAAPQVLRICIDVNDPPGPIPYHFLDTTTKKSDPWHVPDQLNLGHRQANAALPLGYTLSSAIAHGGSGGRLELGGQVMLPVDGNDEEEEGEEDDEMDFEDNDGDSLGPFLAPQGGDEEEGEDMEDKVDFQWEASEHEDAEDDDDDNQENDEEDASEEDGTLGDNSMVVDSSESSIDHTDHSLSESDGTEAGANTTKHLNKCELGWRILDNLIAAGSKPSDEIEDKTEEQEQEEEIKLDPTNVAQSGEEYGKAKRRRRSQATRTQSGKSRRYSGVWGLRGLVKVEDEEFIQELGPGLDDDLSHAEPLWIYGDAGDTRALHRRDSVVTPLRSRSHVSPPKTAPTRAGASSLSKYLGNFWTMLGGDNQKTTAAAADSSGGGSAGTTQNAGQAANAGQDPTAVDPTVPNNGWVKSDGLFSKSSSEPSIGKGNDRWTLATVPNPDQHHIINVRGPENNSHIGNADHEQLAPDQLRANPQRPGHACYRPTGYQVIVLTYTRNPLRGHWGKLERDIPEF
jgi:hypothetical protein